MSLRSKNIDLSKMDIVKGFAYAAVAYSAGHEILATAQSFIDPAPIATQATETWKAFFDNIKSMPALTIGVHLVALSYLGQDLMNKVKSPKLRSEDLDIFSTPSLKAVALGSVATVVGAQIASTAALVGPFYAPLITGGVEAFVNEYAKSEAAQQGVLTGSGSPFSLHAVAVFAAYRYMREDLKPSAVLGATAGLYQSVKNKLASLTGEHSDNHDNEMTVDAEAEAVKVPAHTNRFR